jgi:hypothetical protein
MESCRAASRTKRLSLIYRYGTLDVATGHSIYPRDQVFLAYCTYFRDICQYLVAIRPLSMFCLIHTEKPRSGHLDEHASVNMISRDTKFSHGTLGITTGPNSSLLLSLICGSCSRLNRNSRSIFAFSLSMMVNVGGVLKSDEQAFHNISPRDTKSSYGTLDKTTGSIDSMFGRCLVVQKRSLTMAHVCFLFLIARTRTIRRVRLSAGGAELCQ